MYWPILIVLAVCAMCVGPVLMMQPSNRDKATAALRQKAAGQGLQVRLYKLHDQSVAVYSISWPAKLEIEPWCLAKGPLSHEIHFSGYWHWLEKPAPQQWQVLIKQLLSELGDDIVGIGANNQAFSVYWQEKHKDQFGQVQELLNSYSTKLYSA